jgi:hypothetical protein
MGLPNNSVKKLWSVFPGRYNEFIHTAYSKEKINSAKMIEANLISLPDLYKYNYCYFCRAGKI